MSRSTAAPSPDGLAHPGRPRAAARVAAIIVAAIFAIPAAAGAQFVVLGPAVDCFECGRQTSGPWILGLGIVGLVLAAGIWRMNVAALALGLFLGVLGLALAGGYTALLLTSGGLLREPDFAILAMITGALAVATVSLIVALRGKVADAWRPESSSGR